jgi:hypothetical protein
VSQENVEIVRRVMGCFAAGDIESVLSDIHPQAALDWSNSDAPDRGVYTGHAAWRDFVRPRDDALGERRFDSVELSHARRRYGRPEWTRSGAGTSERHRGCESGCRRMDAS